ncbi:MAG: cupin domain-containing protein [Saprospiraceae bacterium]|nr:cupin domain-containing protein [Saprospiraceae bacterium]
MIQGSTEMEIGNEIHQTTRPGDLYFLGANVPHAIRNTGAAPCMYFAFQWSAGE